VAAGGRLLTALIGQPRLPDSRPAVNHQTGKLTGTQRLLEHLKFRTSADYRPALQRDRHSASMTSRRGKARAYAITIRIPQRAHSQPDE